MLLQNEVLSIILGVMSMGLGIVCLWLSHRVMNAKTIQPLNVMDEELYVDDDNNIPMYNQSYSRLITLLAMICFVCGVLFVYIPSLIVSLIVSGCLILVGFIILFIGYYRIYKRFHVHGK